MGKRGREIVGMNVGKLPATLDKAFADEWLAYYQYWIGSKVIKGPMKEAVIAELVQHAADELRHSEMFTTRIIQLGGAPVIKPEDWYKYTNCGYEAPEDPFVRIILDQNIKGEQCAISEYNRLMEETKDKDPVTYTIVLQILQDEVEHEEDLQARLEDFEAMMKHA